MQLTELYNYFAKIVGMPCEYKESNIADLAFIGRIASKSVLLYVRDSFHEETNSEECYTCNVSSSSKFRLRIFGDIWRVENRDR